MVLLIIIGAIVGIILVIVILGNLSIKKEIKRQLAKAEQGDTQAQYDMFLVYAKNKSFDKAIFFLEKSAENGFIDAQILLGKKLLIGEGLEKNPLKAVDWFKKAIEQESAEGHFQLAKCYEAGNGIDIDLEQSMYHLEQAAGKGHEDAKRKLQKEKYKNDILSGVISYKEEVAKILNLIMEYKAYHQEHADMYKNLIAGLNCGKLDHYARAQLKSYDFKSFNDCQLKLKELIAIKPDPDVEKLVILCKELEKASSYNYESIKKFLREWGC